MSEIIKVELPLMRILFNVNLDFVVLVICHLAEAEEKILLDILDCPTFLKECLLHPDVHLIFAILHPDLCPGKC